MKPLSPDPRHFLEGNSNRQINREWIDSQLACQLLGVTYGALKNLVYRRQIPFYRFGRRLRFKKSELISCVTETHVEKGEW